MLGLDLHGGQKRWLRESIKRQNLLVTGNRWGKSFVCAVKLLYRAFWRIRKLKYDSCSRYRVVTASITQDQANIVFNLAVRLVRQSIYLKPLIVSIIRTPYPKMTLLGGVTIEARSTQNRGEYLLGNDYDLFVFDEVAFETDPEYVVEEVIQMRLADREGMLDLVSTPNGKNWFYLRARDVIEGKRDGYYQTGDSRENTFISVEALDERLRNFTERRVQQNIMGQFVDCGGEILRGEYVDRALAGFDAWDSGKHGSMFISGWDLARKKTATVGVTVEVAGDKVRVVDLQRFRRFDWNVVIEKIKQRQFKYPGQLIVDATGLGDVIVEQLASHHPISVIFTEKTKAELLTNLELFHARGRVAYERWEVADGPGRVWSLEDELRRARWDDNNDCDALMALALALWPLHQSRKVAIEPRLGSF
ncbi:MAG: hypothetical protein JSW34_09760 [Candidatus Zixiibacteriota bacterium]|nr:MAG: hypothetical protein JSW34_09760 [candidate division Zixibacteria bacterium]